MKKILLFLGLCLGFAGIVRAESALVFCETFNDDFVPQNVGTTFPGPGISLFLAQDKPFASPSLTITLYRRDGKRETLIDRASFEINPQWTAYGIRNLPMPGPGEYSIGFTLPDGSPIAQAQVAITGGTGEKPIEPREEVGGTLEKVFNKYSTKKQ